MEPGRLWGQPQPGRAETGLCGFGKTHITVTQVPGVPTKRKLQECAADPFPKISLSQMMSPRACWKEGDCPCPPSMWGRRQLECLGLLGCPGPGIEWLGCSQAGAALGAFAPLPTSPGLLLATKLDVGAGVTVYKCTPGRDSPGTGTGADSRMQLGRQVERLGQL